MKVFVTAQAHRDIAAVKAYVAKNNPAAAKRIAGNLYDEACKLVKDPLKGVSLSAKFGIQTDLRMWIVSPNLLLYKLLGERIIVTRVMGEQTDYLAALGLAERKTEDTEDESTAPFDKKVKLV